MEISATLIWQGIINGLALGWIYVLMALGLTLIFGIMHIMQFAHGEIYMIGAYSVYYLTVSFGLPLIAATLLAMLIMALTGLALERFLFRRLKGQVLSAIVATTGLTLIIQSGAVVLFGLYERSLPLLATGPLHLLGSAIPKDRLIAVAVAVLLSLSLYVFLKKTKYGQAMVASAQSPEGAILQGIGPDQMAALAMVIGCALAAAGGTLAGSLFALSPFMGLAPLVKGLIIIVLGGMGSLIGAFLAGMILGLIDGLVPILFGHAWAAIGPLLLVILVLILKPEGLFGHEE
ncbi:MAG: branched-chain amino acid ABC transporter permease [Deltaproteobacteria bacterium]|nr:branched-chain amino acid ABC transporter permease [Deltaproteobacteria bacterium]